MSENKQSTKSSQAIINPMTWEGGPKLGPLAVISAVTPDTKALVSGLGLDQHQQLPMSRAYFSKRNPKFSVTGPVMGAPYAVYVLEQLIAWGARKIIFLGWCGSISKDLRTGEILSPDSAFVDEGTSVHYSDSEKGMIVRSFPCAEIAAELRQGLESSGLEFSTDPIWTTDALFRETPDKVESFAQKGAVAVEMELSALQTAAAFRGVELCGLLVVSDEVHSGKWKPGFTAPEFKVGRLKAIEVICSLCRQI